MKLPATLPTESVVAIVDTREKLPLDLATLKTVNQSLMTGDYSVVGLENIVTVERKSLDDLLGCVAGGPQNMLSGPPPRPIRQGKA